MALEILLKIGLTVAIIVVAGLSLRWVWTNQLDPRGTASRAVRRLSEPPDWLATREPTKIYQGGKAVGDVAGSVEFKNGYIHFSQLANTTNLDQTMELEYQRHTLRIRRVGGVAGMKSSVIIDDSGSRSVVLTALLEDVLCERVR